MSERVQLLLSDRILGMTLVPEGRVWNYGIGLTQLWSSHIPYSIILDTPLLFWAEEHRPAAFLTVSSPFLDSHFPPVTEPGLLNSLLISKVAKTRLMSRTASNDPKNDCRHYPQPSHHVLSFNILYILLQFQSIPAISF
jgi:hypothetical protein